MQRISKEKLIELHSLGLTNREVAKRLKCHHSTVNYNYKKLGLKSPWANEKINKINDKKAICNKCKKIKNINEFQYGRKGQKYQYKFSYCNKCRKKQIYLNLNSNIDKFLKDRYLRLKRRAKKLNIDFDIELLDFIKQFNNQDGKCFYTDEKLICKVGHGKHKYSLSIDRINCNKGYIKNNFVFCTNQVNTSKSNFTLKEIEKWMPLWYDRIINKEDL